MNTALESSEDNLLSKELKIEVLGNKEFTEKYGESDKANYNPKTKERQKRILSRMLDSQAAMTERGYKDERKSTTGDCLEDGSVHQDPWPIRESALKMGVNIIYFALTQ